MYHPCLQVLYSQFVTLLEEGKVQTSRLESGTSRVYFDVKPSAETVTASTTATSSAAATAPSSMVDSRASSSGVTATTTATSNIAHQKFQRQFFIKV